MPLPSLNKASFEDGSPIDVAMLSSLLSMGADPNALDSNGRPMVHMVTDNQGAGDSGAAALRALKAAGARLDAQNKDGVSAMLMAAKQMDEEACWALVRAHVGDDEAVKSLGWPGNPAEGELDRNSAGEALCVAADKGDAEAMRTLLTRHKADPNYRRKTQDSPSALIWAARALQKEPFERVCDVLLEFGGDVNLVDLNGGTALHWALGCHRSGAIGAPNHRHDRRRNDVVEVLIRKGCNPSKLNFLKVHTPLGSKGRHGSDLGGTAMMFGYRGMWDQHPLSDPNLASYRASMEEWAAIEAKFEAMKGKRGEELTACSDVIIELGFGAEKRCFTGKDRSGKKITNAKDRLQIRHQLWMIGRADQREAERRAVLMGTAAIIPLVALLATEDGRETEASRKAKARAKDLCVYLLDQGVGTYCMNELRAVGQQANDCARATRPVEWAAVATRAHAPLRSARLRSPRLSRA